MKVKLLIASSIVALGTLGAGTAAAYASTTSNGTNPPASATQGSQVNQGSGTGTGTGTAQGSWGQGHNGHHGRRHRMHGVLADAAKALNMTPKDLKTELQKGQSIVQIAKGKGISEAQLTATLKSDLQTRLNKAVQNGKLTQAQAQSRLSRFDTHIGKLLNRQGFPHKKTLAQSGNSASGAQSSN